MVHTLARFKAKLDVTDAMVVENSRVAALFCVLRPSTCGWSRFGHPCLAWGVIFAYFPRVLCYQGFTPLTSACDNACLESVQALLELGADVNARVLRWVRHERRVGGAKMGAASCL